MDLQVIGAGFGRTGTLSMKAALEQLGFGPCHHMYEVFARPDDAIGWAEAIRGGTADLDALLEGFRSSVDFPACLLWERLWRDNPGSQVLLTVRPAEAWWRSFAATIGPGIHPAEPHEDEGFATLPAAIDDVVFSGRADDEATAVAAYEAHNARVIATVPADRLCVYEVGSGWDPLCSFLGVDPPDTPFPHTNTSEEWQDRA